MPRVCTACSHPDRPAIDQMLVNLRPFRAIADHFGLSHQAIMRHHDDHLPAALAKAQEQEDVRRAIDHVAQLKAINAATVAILKDARQAGDHDLALRAIDRVQKQIELQAKLIGELDDRPQVNLLVAPQWLELRVQILAALQPYPEARLAVSDLAMALDPAHLIKAAGLIPDDWQLRAIRSGSSRLLLNASRQSGKSTVSAALAVHTALYEPRSLVLLLSPSLRQSQELFRKALDFYRAADQAEPPEAESALRLELTNGSRIVSLPGKEGTVRGYSGVRLLVIDEAARVPDELYYSVRPMLAVSGGRLLALSTPFGTRGWWYEAWRSAEAWDRFEVPATACPRIRPEFLAEEQRTLGAWWFEQEYLCRFLDAQSQAFRREDVDRAFSEEVQVWRLG